MQKLFTKVLNLNEKDDDFSTMWNGHSVAVGSASTTINL